MKEPIYKSLYEYCMQRCVGCPRTTPKLGFGEDKKGIQNPSNLKGLRSHLLN